jgi:hypothetical protein
VPTVAFRVTRSRRAFVNAPKVRDVLSKALDDEVKPHFIQAFEDVVSNWKNKPTFQGRKFITADSIKVNVYPVGANKQIYIYVTGGTRPHAIRPRNARYLAFMWGGAGSYKAKTAPGGKWGGPGVVSGGKMRFTKEVHHPGNAPRDFEAFIRKREAPWYSRTMNNAWKRAIRAMQS